MISLEQRARLSNDQLTLLEASLSTYGELAVNAELLAEQMETEKAKIGQVLADAGIDKDATEHFSLCWIRDAKVKKLDPTKLIAQGVTMAQIDKATVETSKKPYFQIRSKKKPLPRSSSGD